MSDPLSILVISGSPRPVSYTRSLTHAISGVLRGHGQEVAEVNLQDVVLPPMDPALRAAGPDHPDSRVAELFRRAAAADAFVLGSPLYHNSYSGALKNALDYLGIKHFRKRAVGLASHGGASSQAVDHLRIVVRGVLGVAITTQVCTADADFAEAPGSDGLYAVIDSGIHERIARFAAELILFGRQLRAIRAEEAATE